MPMRIGLFVLFTLFCQQCYAMTSTMLAKARMDDFQRKLQDNETSPILCEVIAGTKYILEDANAKQAFQATLDETITMIQDEEAMKTIDYMMESLKLAIQKQDVQTVLRKSLIRSAQTLVTPDTKQFLEQGRQTLYQLLTDPEILATLRHLIIAARNILTDEQSQGTLADLLLAVNRVAQDKESLAHIQQTVRAVDDILSDRGARDTITQGVDMLDGFLSQVSANSAKRIGAVMQNTKLM